MPIGSSSGEYFADEGALLVAQNKSFGPMSAKEKSDRKEIDSNETSGDFQSRFGAIDIRPLTPATMPPGGPTELAGALKPEGGTNVSGNQYETRLSSEEETKFQAWKQQNAPNDSGADYDLRGSYQAGLQPAENG